MSFFAGSIGVTLRYRIRTTSGTPPPLVGATVSLVLPGGTERVCSVVDAYTVQYVTQAGDFPTPGAFLAQLKIAGPGVLLFSDPFELLVRGRVA
jgi:hypothetical protein